MEPTDQTEDQKKVENEDSVEKQDENNNEDKDEENADLLKTNQSETTSNEPVQKKTGVIGQRFIIFCDSHPSSFRFRCEFCLFLLKKLTSMFK
jgi:hypothetical protein